MLKSLRKLVPADHPAVQQARRLAVPVGHVVAPVIAAIQRSMARDVMLFAGGASFFSMLALFPALALAMSLYGFLFSMEDARAQFARFAEIIPGGAQSFVLDQMERIANVPLAAVSLNGFIALAVTLFAAARGMKALIAGLNHLASGQDLRNVLHFNLLAMVSLMIGAGLVLVANAAVLVIPVFFRRLSGYLGVASPDVRLVVNEWTASGAVLLIALVLLYRMTMQRRRQRESVSWRASWVAAIVSTTLWLLISKGFSTYVGYVIDASVYGSIGALVVLLLWIYWSAYAVFFGGALAVELDRRHQWSRQGFDEDEIERRSAKVLEIESEPDSADTVDEKLDRAVGKRSARPQTGGRED
ncbi:YihY/virulence factor BrkB family protein [Maricaulis sp. CAU 1757]